MQSVMFYGLACGHTLLFWLWASGKSELDTSLLNKGGVKRAKISFLIVCLFCFFIFLLNGKLVLGMWKEKGSCVTENMNTASGSAAEFATNSHCSFHSMIFISSSVQENHQLLKERTSKKIKPAKKNYRVIFFHHA